MYKRHGVKMVAYDRPGYGGSDPKSAARRRRGADIAAIADELGFDRFAVVGGSGGAPHALACGALLTTACSASARSCARAVGRPAFDFYEGLAEINVKEFGAALEGRRRSRPSSSRTSTGSGPTPDAAIEEILSELPEVDREIASRDGFRTVMRESFSRGRAPGRARLGRRRPRVREVVGLRAGGRACRGAPLAGRAGRARAAHPRRVRREPAPERPLRAARGRRALPRRGVGRRARLAAAPRAGVT